MGTLGHGNSRDIEDKLIEVGKKKRVNKERSTAVMKKKKSRRSNYNSILLPPRVARYSLTSGAIESLMFRTHEQRNCVITQ